jgi:hypothetical protein
MLAKVAYYFCRAMLVWRCNQARQSVALTNSIPFYEARFTKVCFAGLPSDVATAAGGNGWFSADNTRSVELQLKPAR